MYSCTGRVYVRRAVLFFELERSCIAVHGSCTSFYTFTLLEGCLQNLHFYTFTGKRPNFYATPTLCTAALLQRPMRSQAQQR